MEMAFQFPWKTSKKSTPIAQASNTFFPLEFLNGYLINSLDADQRKMYQLYLQVPELQAIIAYKARVASQMKIIAVDDAGERIEKPNVDTTALFRNPNPIQRFNEFFIQYYSLRTIFGNAFIHPVFGIDPSMTRTLWNLPPMDAEVVPVNNNLIPFNMTEKDEIIEAYKFFFNGNRIIYKSDEIIHFNDNQIQFDRKKWLLGDSKIRPLIQACENIKNAYEARGILIQNSALGFLSNETQDAQGTADLNPDDKDALQKEFKEKYGLTRNKWQVILTNARLRWVPMVVNMTNLKLFEEVDADFRTIANQMNFPPEILQTESTYENKQKAIKQLYQEAIIPECDEWLEGLSEGLKLDFLLQSDFSHISILQEDLNARSQALNYASTALSKAVQAGIISPADAEEQLKKYLL